MLGISWLAEEQLVSEGLCSVQLVISLVNTNQSIVCLTLKLPTTTIVAQPFNVIKWQLKFNLVA